MAEPSTAIRSSARRAGLPVELGDEPLGQGGQIGTEDAGVRDRDCVFRMFPGCLGGELPAGGPPAVDRRLVRPEIAATCSALKSVHQVNCVASLALQGDALGSGPWRSFACTT